MSHPAWNTLLQTLGLNGEVDPSVFDRLGEDNRRADRDYRAAEVEKVFLRACEHHHWPYEAANRLRVNDQVAVLALLAWGRPVLLEEFTTLRYKPKTVTMAGGVLDRIKNARIPLTISDAGLMWLSGITELNPADVYVCFGGTTDRNFARCDQLTTRLRDRQISFWTRRQVSHEWPREAQMNWGIARAKVMVLLWSADSLSKTGKVGDDLSKEIDWARELEKRWVVVRYFEAPPRLPAEVASSVAAEILWGDQPQESWAALLKALEAVGVPVPPEFESGVYCLKGENRQTGDWESYPVSVVWRDYGRERDPQNPDKVVVGLSKTITRASQFQARIEGDVLHVQQTDSHKNPLMIEPPGEPGSPMLPTKDIHLATREAFETGGVTFTFCRQEELGELESDRSGGTLTFKLDGQPIGHLLDVTRDMVAGHGRPDMVFNSLVTGLAPAIADDATARVLRVDVRGQYRQLAAYCPKGVDLPGVSQKLISQCIDSAKLRMYDWNSNGDQVSGQKDGLPTAVAGVSWAISVPILREATDSLILYVTGYDRFRHSSTRQEHQAVVGGAADLVAGLLRSRRLASLQPCMNEDQFARIMRNPQPFLEPRPLAAVTVMSLSFVSPSADDLLERMQTHGAIVHKLKSFVLSAGGFLLGQSSSELMACWGLTDDQDAHATLALDCALQLKTAGPQDVKLSMGISTGPVVAGNVGTTYCHFDVAGAPLQEAELTRNLARILGAPVLLANSTRTHTSDALTVVYRALGRFTWPSHPTPIDVCELLGDDDPEHLAERYQHALQLRQSDPTAYHHALSALPEADPGRILLATLDAGSTTDWAVDPYLLEGLHGLAPV